MCRLINFQQTPFCKSYKNSLLDLHRLCNLPGSLSTENLSPLSFTKIIGQTTIPESSQFGYQEIYFHPPTPSQIFFRKAHYYRLNKSSVMLSYAQQELCSTVFYSRSFGKMDLNFYLPVA